MDRSSDDPGSEVRGNTTLASGVGAHTDAPTPPTPDGPISTPSELSQPGAAFVGEVNPEGVSQDNFLDGKLKLYQPKKGYRAGIDAVLLAASVPAQAGQTALELGAGVGVASLCLAHRVDGLSLTGIEIQPAMVRLAQQNAARNGLDARAKFVSADLSGPRRLMMEQGITPNLYDHVLANPPYYEPDSSWVPPDESKRKAHTTQTAALADWVDTACAMARPKGTVTFIHRADALPGLLHLIGTRLGAMKAFPLWPHRNADASRVLLQGVKTSRGPFALRAGLVLHEGDYRGDFTTDANALLRTGAALKL